MTEDEAKTKICCGPLHQPEFQKIGEIAVSKPMPRNCVGSACMAWRWNEGMALLKGEFPDGTTTEIGHKCLSEALGHCGLAGRS